MFKRYVYVLFLLSFSVSFIVPQSVIKTKEVKIQREGLVDENKLTDVKSNPSFKAPNYVKGDPTVGEPIGPTTNYDTWSNSIVRDQIVFSGGSPHFANMVRPWNGVAARRMVAYTYKTGDTYTTVPVFDAAASSGWPHIDASLTGSAAGTIAIVGHTPNRLAIWDGSSSFLVSQFEAFTDPSLQFVGDNIFIATSGNRLQFQFFKTTDFGISFSNFDSISTWNGTNNIFFNIDAGDGSVEAGLSKSPNEQNVVYFGGNYGVDGINGNYTWVFNGFSPDSSDNFWAIWSTNAGSTWSGKSINASGIIGQLDGLPDFAPMVSYWNQHDMVITNNAVLHAVSNGMGYGFNATRDSVLYQYSLVYWNSVDDKWKSIAPFISDPDQEIHVTRPGRLEGWSFPGIAASEDGKVLYVTWTGPQYTNGLIDTVHGQYWTDMYHAYSLDAGKTWTYLGPMAGASKKDVAESYGHPAEFLQSLGNNKYRAHIVYLADLDAGSTLSTQGSATDNPIIYQTYDIDAGPVGVNDNNIVNSFELKQNYPNPFNPNTSIKYSVAERSNVTLKVFDMLGREVSTLVNTVKEAGSYEVNFNASNLSSGLYIYTINAGNYSSSKKMMLLK